MFYNVKRELLHCLFWAITNAKTHSRSSRVRSGTFVWPSQDCPDLSDRRLRSHHSMIVGLSTKTKEEGKKKRLKGKVNFIELQGLVMSSRIAVITRFVYKVIVEAQALSCKKVCQLMRIGVYMYRVDEQVSTGSF